MCAYTVCQASAELCSCHAPFDFNSRTSVSFTITGVLIKHTCLIRFVGIGCSRHVDYLDEEIREWSSGRSMSVKDLRGAPGCGGVAEVAIVHSGRAVGS